MQKLALEISELPVWNMLKQLFCYVGIIILYFGSYQRVYAKNDAAINTN